MRYVGPPVTTAQALKAYTSALNNVRNMAFNTRIPIQQEQLETMRELSQTMKGLIFNEHTRI